MPETNSEHTRTPTAITLKCCQVRDALRDKRCLLVVDDVWESKLAVAFKDLLDHSAGSRLLVTTRFKGLIVGSKEIVMGKLTNEEVSVRRSMRAICYHTC